MLDATVRIHSDIFDKSLVATVTDTFVLLHSWVLHLRCAQTHSLTILARVSLLALHTSKLESAELLLTVKSEEGVALEGSVNHPTVQ